MLAGSLRIAIDMGGAFSQVQALEENSGTTFASRCPSTPEDPALGLIDATVREIEVRRRYPQDYGYEFFVARSLD